MPPLLYRLFMFALLLVCGAGAGRVQAIPSAAATQPTGLAHHRSGQTFLTWREQPGAAPRYPALTATPRRFEPLATWPRPRCSTTAPPRFWGCFYASNRYNVDAGGVWGWSAMSHASWSRDGGPELAAGVGLLV